MASDRVWRMPSEPLPEVVVRVPEGVVHQDAEDLVAEAFIKVRSGLEAEGVEMDVGAAALAGPRLDGLEQAPPPAVAAPVLVHPEEGDVEPRRPRVTDRAPPDRAVVVAQEDAHREPVRASRDDDVPAVQAVADRLAIGLGRLIFVDDAKRHGAPPATPARSRAVATRARTRRETSSLAACSTLVRPAASRRAGRARPAKSVDTPPAPATSAMEGMRFGTFSFTTRNAPPCDSIQTGASCQPNRTRPSALRFAYCRRTSKAPPSCRFVSRRYSSMPRTSSPGRRVSRSYAWNTSR